MKKYFYIVILLLSCLFSETESNRIYYFQPGPNLVSFDILPDNATVENIFNSNQNNIIAIISSGEVSYNNTNDWVGNLTNINTNDGYWIVTSDVVLINLSGPINNNTTYLLNHGANLISYPYEVSQEINQALPFYMYDNLYAIIGQDEAALMLNNQVVGSLTHFEPNKGYWLLMENSLPFQYNEPSLTNSSNNFNYITLDIESPNSYNQSILQSVFFIENAFFNGSEILENEKIIVKCNNRIVGETYWLGELTDLIAMGKDDFVGTENYCEDFQDISIFIERNDSEYIMEITGNKKWENNSISIISISDLETGDINMDANINITDIVLLIEHIISDNSIYNSHQLFLSDLNNDTLMNVTDIILVIEKILR